MPTIVTPHTFFVSEREKIYDDWRLSWWRELFSNSIDAGAKRLLVEGQFMGTGANQVYRVRFVDDGCGMDRDTIENVYMRLGASTKTGVADNIGGFGRARILTCFSQLGYAIHTGDVIVQGSGAQYEVGHTEKIRRGCAVTIDMEPCHARGLHSRLETFLQQSTLPVELALKLPSANPETGESLPFAQEREGGKPAIWKGTFHRGRSIRAFEQDGEVWAQASMNKSEKALRNRLLVRVLGATMYSQYIAAPVQVTIDLEPGKARQALTASRDSLSGKFRDDLNAFVDELTVNVRSATRDRSIKPTLYAYRGAFGPIRLTNGVEQAPSHGLMTGSHPMSARGGVDSSLPEEGHFMVPGRAIAIYVDDPSPAQRSSMRHYMPDCMFDPDVRRGMTARKLLAGWTAAIEACAEALGRVLERKNERLQAAVSPGMVFSKDFAGLAVRIDHGEWGILMNPLDENGRCRFRISEAADYRRLTALAAHEVCHLMVGPHNEDFAALLTDVVGEIDQRKVCGDIRKAIENEHESIRREALMNLNQPATNEGVHGERNRDEPDRAEDDIAPAFP